jgi:GDP-L-fucose synthase
VLQNKNFKIIECRRKDLDFTSQEQVNKWFERYRPDIVINAAGRVGGILDNANNKTDYIYINTMIGFNILNASLKYNVQKLINLGSACIYPQKTKQPIKEKYLLSSKLEPSNEGYSIAKIATIKYCQYIKEFIGKDFISLQPANLYGERDNYDLKKSHVIPALVRKFHEAKIKNQRLLLFYLYHNWYVASISGYGIYYFTVL